VTTFIKEFYDDDDEKQPTRYEILREQVTGKPFRIIESGLYMNNK